LVDFTRQCPEQSIVCDPVNLLELLFSLRSPVAYISGATEVGTVAAPVMADFSSPGPNFITPEILKVLLIASHERFKIHAQY